MPRQHKPNSWKPQLQINRKTNHLKTMLSCSSHSSRATLSAFSHFLPTTSPYFNFSSLSPKTFSPTPLNFGWRAATAPKPRMASTFPARASAQPLQNADELIDSVETFIFDCDGESSACLCWFLPFWWMCCFFALLGWLICVVLSFGFLRFWFFECFVVFLNDFSWGFLGSW